MIEIKLTVDPNNRAQIKALNDFFKASQSQDEAQAPKRKTRAKQETLKEPQDTEEVPDEDLPFTEEQVRAILSTKVKNHREAIKEKLTSLGAKNVSTLAKTKYAGFVKYLKKLA